mgnify:CR=1 FL=1
MSYERFTACQERVLLPLMLYLKYRGLGKSRGINYIDSTLLRVCHIKREKQNKVFKDIAEKGKSTMGWVFGFKLHLIINDKVKEFERDYLEFLKAKHADVLSTLKAGKLTDEVTDTLTAVAKDLSSKYKA